MIAPHERHWHGAGPKNTMVHLALQEADEKNVHVVWLDHVTDEEYGAKSYGAGAEINLAAPGA